MQLLKHHDTNILRRFILRIDLAKVARCFDKTDGFSFIWHKLQIAIVPIFFFAHVHVDLTEDRVCQPKQLHCAFQRSSSELQRKCKIMKSYANLTHSEWGNSSETEVCPKFWLPYRRLTNSTRTGFRDIIRPLVWTYDIQEHL